MFGLKDSHLIESRKTTLDIAVAANEGTDVLYEDK